MNTRVNGYSSNLERFSVLYDLLNAYGKDYNPPQREISLPDLRSYLDILETHVEKLETFRSDYRKAVASCKAVSNEALLCARASIRLLTRERVPELLSEALICLKIIQDGRNEQHSATEMNEVTKDRQSFASGFDQRLLAFQELVMILRSDPGYRPINGFDSLEHIREVEEKMSARRTELAIAAYRLAQGKATCTRLLFAAGNGAAARTSLAKSHIKRTYGKESQRYAEISEIHLKKVGWT